MQTNNSISDKSHDQFVQFLKDERYEMERYKWIESEKAGYDLGNKAIADWIKKYAASYRAWWEETHKNTK